MHWVREILLLSILIAAPTAADTAGTRQQPERFRTSTAAVVVDVVVHDREGRPVPGLTAHDFAVYEDGVRQTITSFDVVGGPSRATTGDQNPAAAVHSAVPLSTQPTPAMVALVFEQLSPEGRQLAEKAANAFVTEVLTSLDSAAVFTMDRALHPIVPYTNDVDALRKGVHRAILRPGYALEHAGQVPGAEFGSSDPGQPSQSTKEDRPAVRARATFDALEALVDSMQPRDGRKVVLFFSEGLALMPSEESSPDGTPSHNVDSWLSDGRYAQFLRLFDRASRAHVAFYTFDAKGLRIEGLNGRSSCFGCAPYVGLQLLADQTGGAFVDSTNDLVEPVRRVGADLRSYYLLGYTSTNARVDDKYRKINVKIQRNDVQILARKGYVASNKTRK